jgi:hypothetical protein
VLSRQLEPIESGLSEPNALCAEFPDFMRNLVIETDGHDNM